jgi:fatty-acyl-CoA synthase
LLPGNVSDECIESDKLARDAWLRALQLTAPITQTPTVTLPIVIDHIAEASPATMALTGEPESLTYRALADRAHHYASWTLRPRVRPGDVVCLLMQNCPEYMAIWLGITRIGGVVALVNTPLTGDALIHAINTVAPKHPIVGAGLVEAVDAVLPRLDSAPSIWVHGQNHPSHARIDDEITWTMDDGLRGAESSTQAERALCIYTSGTTGFPKPRRPMSVTFG